MYRFMGSINDILQMVMFYIVTASIAVSLFIAHQVTMCDRPLRELSNPGASGSLFYLSAISTEAVAWILPCTIAYILYYLSFYMDLRAWYLQFSVLFM